MDTETETEKIDVDAILQRARCIREIHDWDGWEKWRKVFFLCFFMRTCKACGKTNLKMDWL